MEENNNKKRVLHVIRVVYDILSALFIVFVSSALVINAVSRGDKQKQDILTPNIQEVKQVRNYGYVDEYGIQACFYPTDFTSNSFILALISNLSKEYNFLSYDNVNTGNITFNSSHSYGGGFYSINDGVVASLVYSTSQFVVNKTSSTQYSNDVIESVYILSIYDTNNTKRLEYKYYVDYPSLDYNENDIGVNCIRVDSLVDPLDVVNRWWVYRENNNDNFSPLINYVVRPNIEDFSTRYNDGYKSGYDYGYSQGERIGYNNGKADGQEIGDRLGYNRGYNEGLVDGAQGIESNAFTVIGQAFEAVGNIFSIEVLPGLPLWILAFTPLIIAVVIVVIKMIKG